MVLEKCISRKRVKGVTPAQVPLPTDLSINDPIYVNVMQYRAMLRRRQHRAKLEAQNIIVKNWKPYLHESRHQYAVRRAKGSGGRFLNKKELQELNPSSSTGDIYNFTGSNSFHLIRITKEPGVNQQKQPAFETSGSDVTGTSTSTIDDIFRPSEFRFYDYSIRMAEPMQDLVGNYF